jgi:hypothetical protein
MKRVYIPTYKRLNRQPTLQALSAAGVPTVLVVRNEELQGALDLAQKHFDCTVFGLPPGISNIGQTRQWVVENNTFERLIMMDDDLQFAVRGKREGLLLSPATDEDVNNMVEWMWETLRDETLVGISAREGNNRKEDSREECTRMMRAWGLRTDVFKKIGARFDNLPCIEDFDVILTFLTNGYKNIVNNEYTTNQAGSNVDGGCSTYRTLEVQADAARALAAKYPGIVKAVEKTTKGSWGGGVRIDVNIFWKKAYQQGVNHVSK